MIKQISQKSKVKKTQDCSNKTMFFNHATDRKANTKVALLIIELSPLCHKEQQLKIKIGKALEFGGSAKRNTYVYVRFASWSKFPICQWPLYLVADD